eukprot:1177347-Prorocentrum_minimum.AAC.2
MVRERPSRDTPFSDHMSLLKHGSMLSISSVQRQTTHKVALPCTTVFNGTHKVALPCTTAAHRLLQCRECTTVPLSEGGECAPESALPVPAPGYCADRCGKTSEMWGVGGRNVGCRGAKRGV